MSVASRGLARLRSKGFALVRAGDTLSLRAVSPNPEPLDVTKTRQWLAKHRPALLRILEAESRPEVAALQSAFAGLGCRVVALQLPGESEVSK